MSPAPTSEGGRWCRLQAVLDEPAAEAPLTAREVEVRDAVRRVVATDVAPRAGRLDRDHTFAHDSYQALAGAGLAGLRAPEACGGTDDSHVAYALAMEEITAGCPATSLVYMTQMHTAHPVLLAGSPELVTRHVPGLVDGSTYGSLLVTEPAAGSDAASLRTHAVRDADGGYRLSGSKTFITTGDRSGVLVCFATVDPSAGRAGITGFVVTGDAAGLTRGEPFHKMGMHGSTTSEVFLDGVAVPADHRLGDEGEGWQVLLASVVKSRISAAAQGVGIARGALAHALLATRTIHGPRLPADVAAGLAELRGRLLRARLLLHGVAREVDRGRAGSGAIGLMKQGCTDAGWDVALAATRVLGEHGDLVDLGVERYLRDAKVTQIYDGTNEVQRLLAARETAGRLEEALP